MVFFPYFYIWGGTIIKAMVEETEIDILSLSKVGERGRIYLPKKIADEMNVSEGNYVSFDVGERVILNNGRKGETSRKIRTQNRLTLPDKVLDRLSLERGDSVLLCREEYGEGKKHTIRRA